LARKVSELQGCSELMPVLAAPEAPGPSCEALWPCSGPQDVGRQLQACSELVVTQAAAAAAAADEAGGAPMAPMLVVPRIPAADADPISRPPLLPRPSPSGSWASSTATLVDADDVGLESVTVVSDLRDRLRRAELAIVERDRRIELLEVRLLAADHRGAGASAQQDTSWAAPRSVPPPSCSILLAHAEEALRIQKLRDQEDIEIEACVEAACRKSDTLLRKIAGLGGVEEPEQQWISLMSAHEDCRDRLAQIEAIVQRRVEQLPPGDSELKVCRAVRGLCVGVQRFTARRWALADM